MQGLGEIARGMVVGLELLQNFEQIGAYDFFMVQEHKLAADRIPFVKKRLKNGKAFWTPAVKVEDGLPKGGLAIFVGEKYADKILDAGMDPKNTFMWLTVATETGQLGCGQCLWGAFPGWQRQDMEADGSGSG